MDNQETKKKRTFKEVLLTKIPKLQGWIVVGALSAVVLIIQIVLISKA